MGSAPNVLKFGNAGKNRTKNKNNLGNNKLLILTTGLFKNKTKNVLWTELGYLKISNKQFWKISSLKITNTAYYII